MVKINYKGIGLSTIVSLLFATIVNILFSKMLNVSELPIGKAWIILLISIFIVYFFIAVTDRKINKQEILTMIIIAGICFISGWAIKYFLPELFSMLPTGAQSMFNSLGV